MHIIKKSGEDKRGEETISNGSVDSRVTEDFLRERGQNADIEDETRFCTSGVAVESLEMYDPRCL